MQLRHGGGGLKRFRDFLQHGRLAHAEEPRRVKLVRSLEDGRHRIVNHERQACCRSSRSTVNLPPRNSKRVLLAQRRLRWP